MFAKNIFKQYKNSSKLSLRLNYDPDLEQKVFIFFFLFTFKFGFRNLGENGIKQDKRINIL